MIRFFHVVQVKPLLDSSKQEYDPPDARWGHTLWRVPNIFKPDAEEYYEPVFLCEQCVGCNYVLQKVCDVALVANVYLQ